jgi:O-antigen ligase
MRQLPFALALLVGAVAWNWGGYDPWALLTLELGASLLVVAIVARDSRAPAGDLRARREAWKRLPFWTRHPNLSAAARLVTLGRWPRRRASPGVEIILPGAAGRSPVELDLAREGFLLGLPFRRTGLFVPLALVSVWIALSLAPLPPALLSILSPRAAALRAEAEGLVGSDLASAPLSLAPYPSLRGLWIWLAALGLFYASVRTARTREGVLRLGLGLVVLGMASGALGVAGFFSELHAARGRASEALRATGSFGNPNHYAAFQGMLLVSSVGFLAWLRERSSRTAKGRGRSNEGGLAAIAGLAILLAALGLLLSLSRSGIASAAGGVLAFAALTRRTSFERPGKRLGALAALAVAILVVALWIGVEPLVGRFVGVTDEWDREATRIQVWRDSAPAVRDYWLTGSGLSSFRYVGSRYRSFGGRIFYSWAHNDYLQLAIELGLPGLALLGWIGASVVRAARRVRRDFEPERPLLDLHAGLAGAVVAIALHSFTDFSLHLPANLALFAVILGAVVGMERERAG